MHTPINIALIIGSLREASINRKYAHFIISQMPDHVTVQESIIADLPLYNQDYDNQDIASYDRLRSELNQADAVLIVTPEHNRTMTAALKNAIDIGSRPYGSSVWDAKKVAVVTASPGTYGARGSALDVRKSMQALHAEMMISPEVYLARANENLDEDGKVTNERTQQFLQKFVNAFVDFVGG